MVDQDIQVQRPPVSFFNREPVAIAAAVRAVIYLASLYGLGVDETQMAAIVVAVESILALFTRQQVTPFVATGTTPNVENPADTPLIDPKA